MKRAGLFLTRNVRRVVGAAGHPGARNWARPGLRWAGGAGLLGVAGLSTAALASAAEETKPTPAAPADPSSDTMDPTLQAKLKKNRKKAKDKDFQEALYIAPSDESQICLFGGNGNPTLAREIASLLGTQLGRATVTKFADGEANIRIHDNVRGKDVYVIQPTCYPANDNLMELILMVTTLKRASAGKVTAVIPYFSYARQLDRNEYNSTIAGADVALMLQFAGVDHVVAVDLHKAQVQGFFHGPVEVLDTTQSVVPYFMHQRLKNPVVVSPASSGVYRATTFRDALGERGVQASLALLFLESKEGVLAQEGLHHWAIPESEFMEVVGDVKGRDCVIVDDMVDTGSRMCGAAAALKRHGANRVFAYATHGVLSGNAVERINTSELTELVIFNTIPLPMNNWSPALRQLSVAGLIAEAIRRLSRDESLSAMLHPSPSTK